MDVVYNKLIHKHTITVKFEMTHQKQRFLKPGGLKQWQTDRLKSGEAAE